MIITFDARVPITADAGEETRTIRGVAVPWDREGTVSDGQRVRFAPGSLEAGARPIVTLGHDGAPFGRTIHNESTDTGMETVVRVSRTTTGDEALILAADGVLGMFSVGVNPTDHHYDGDVLVVDSGDWHHTALLPFGAFADALVTHVAASEETSMPDIIETTDPAPDIEAGEPPVPAVIPIVSAKPVRPELTLAKVAELCAAENRGELPYGSTRAAINAALTSIVSPTGGVGVVQPAYRASVTDVINHGRPLINAINGSTLPASGMAIEYPQWTTPPTVGVQATEKTAVTSTAAVIGIKTAAVQTWAGANDLSVQLVERSSPSFMEAYLRAMAASYAKQTDTYVATTLLAAATAATAGASFVDNVAALFAALNPATTPPGGMFLAMGWTVGQSMIGVKDPAGPAFWEGSINLGSNLPGTAGAGLDMFIDPNMAADMMLLGAKNGATWYESAGAPADIRVVDVELLGINVAVYGFGALAVEYPGAFAKLDTVP